MKAVGGVDKRAFLLPERKRSRHKKVNIKTVGIKLPDHIMKVWSWAIGKVIRHIYI